MPTAEQQSRWCVLTADGTRQERGFCPNSPWADEFLVPFCREAMTRYAPALFWFDGSRVARLCYCDFCRAVYRTRFGEDLAPPADANQRAHQHLAAETGLVAGMEHVARALHETDPGVVVCWANGLDFHTLRPPFDGVGWIGGDETNAPDLALTRFYGTCCGTLGLPWSLWIPDVALIGSLRLRPWPLLRLESASVLAHGGQLCLWHVV